MFGRLFKKEKIKGFTLEELNEIYEKNFRLAILNEATMNLSLVGETGTSSRLVVKGVYAGGEVIIRVDKSLDDVRMLEQFNLVKDILTFFVNTMTREYNFENFEFVKFEDNLDYSSTIYFKLNGLDKEISYRGKREESEMEHAIVAFIEREGRSPEIKGTFRIGDRRFIELMNENRGRQIKIEIVDPIKD